MGRYGSNQGLERISVKLLGFFASVKGKIETLWSEASKDTGEQQQQTF